MDVHNNVLLVKIEGPVWYTIYHHLPVVKGGSSNPSINQPTNGKRTSMDVHTPPKNGVLVLTHAQDVDVGHGLSIG
jgi:hypothetical protein